MVRKTGSTGDALLKTSRVLYLTAAKKLMPQFRCLAILFNKNGQAIIANRLAAKYLPQFS